MLQIMDAMQPAGEQDRAGWQEMPVLYEKRNHGGWLTLSRPNRISCRSYSTNDTALHDAATKPALHRRDARQTAGRPGRTAQGDGDRGQGIADKTTMVKAGRVVGDAMSGQYVKLGPM